MIFGECVGICVLGSWMRGELLMTPVVQISEEGDGGSEDLGDAIEVVVGGGVGIDVISLGSPS